MNTPQTSLKADNASMCLGDPIKKINSIVVVKQLRVDRHTAKNTMLCVIVAQEPNAL